MRYQVEKVWVPGKGFVYYVRDTVLDRKIAEGSSQEDSDIICVALNLGESLRNPLEKQ